ncbi:MAG: hypothetical protein EBS55_15160 [Flavobacteriaceae bacterium]|nr:hypothetical protein [Flavobacteriaceae bacterium]
MKHKITIKHCEYECADGCCYGVETEWRLNGELVHCSPCENSGWLKVLEKLGIDAVLVGIDENDEEIWEL